MKYKPYVELHCKNVKEISNEIYNFLRDHTDVLASNLFGWKFLNSKELLASSSSLKKFFTERKLYVRDSAITLIDKDFPLHIDPLPVIAKINFPVINTDGWTNCWYDIADKDFSQLPTYTTEFGHITEDVSKVSTDKLSLAAELKDMKMPIVFNSRMAHSVIKNNPLVLPRIIASFTFNNEPLDLLK